MSFISTHTDQLSDLDITAAEIDSMVTVKVHSWEGGAEDAITKYDEECDEVFDEESEVFKVTYSTPRQGIGRVDSHYHTYNEGIFRKKLTPAILENIPIQLHPDFSNLTPDIIFNTYHIFNTDADESEDESHGETADTEAPEEPPELEYSKELLEHLENGITSYSEPFTIYEALELKTGTPSIIDAGDVTYDGSAPSGATDTRLPSSYWFIPQKRQISIPGKSGIHIEVHYGFVKHTSWKPLKPN